MAMGGGGSTYRSADGIWHAAIDIEPDRATGRRRRLTAQGKTKAVANTRLRMKLDAYVRKGLTPNSPSPRLMDWLETWYHERAEANLRPNSRRSYENAIVRLNRIAGARRINSLDKDMADIQDGPEVNIESHRVKLHVKLRSFAQSRLNATNLRHLAANMEMNQFQAIFQSLAFHKVKRFEQFAESQPTFTTG